MPIKGFSAAAQHPKDSATALTAQEDRVVSHAKGR